MPRNLDKIDREIVRMLRKDGRLGDTEIGKVVGLGPNAVRKRRNRLEETGIIERYTVYISDKRSAYTGFYYVIVSLQSNNISIESDFESKMIAEKDVLFCDGIQGDNDYILYVGSTADHPIEAFGSEVRSLPYVKSVVCIRVVASPKTYTVHPDRLLCA